MYYLISTFMRGEMKDQGEQNIRRLSFSFNIVQVQTYTLNAQTLDIIISNVLIYCNFGMCHSISSPVHYQFVQHAKWKIIIFLPYKKTQKKILCKRQAVINHIVFYI